MEFNHFKKKTQEKDWSNYLKLYIQNCEGESSSKLLKIKVQELTVLANLESNIHSRIMAHDVLCLIQLIMFTENTEKKNVKIDDCIWILKTQLKGFMKDSIIGDALKEAIDFAK